MSLIQTAALLGSLVASVSAHGFVQGIVAGGTYYTGYSPSFKYDNPPPTVIGWSIPEDSDIGFIEPSNYTTPEIICHLGATPGGATAKVAAGDVVELQWTVWPVSHHGPVMNYLANCNGPCTSVDKTTLEFFNIGSVGLIDGSVSPGNWASDQLIANNNSWTVTIPSSIAPGNYVLRHEIIALHSAYGLNGAQNYPQCINLEITGSGTDAPSGTLGEALYSETAPGISINIYTSLATYAIPGPTEIAAAVSMVQTEVAIGDTAPATTAAASTAVASSAAYSAPTSSAAPVMTSSSVAAPASTYYSSAAPAPTSSSAASAVYISSSASAVYTYSSASAVYTASASPVAPVNASSSYSYSVPVTVVTVTSTTSATYASPPASTVSSAAVVSPYAPIAKLTSVLPSGALTSAIPTALPTSYHHGHKPHDTMPLPTKALPEGMTLKDLLDWIAYLMSDLMKDMEGESRQHPRDLKAVAQ